jgi:hypothetical protein
MRRAVAWLVRRPVSRACAAIRSAWTSRLQAATSAGVGSGFQRGAVAGELAVAFLQRRADNVGADVGVWADVSMLVRVCSMQDAPGYLAGETMIDQAALTKARSDLRGQGPWIAPVGSRWMRVEIGRRRLLADGGTNGRGARWMSADLHEDGSGAFAAYVLDTGSETGVRATGEPAIRRVNDGLVVNGILSGVRFLARHARDRSAAGGNALIRCQLYPVSRQQPLELVHVNMGSAMLSAPHVG